MFRYRAVLVLLLFCCHNFLGLLTLLTAGAISASPINVNAANYGGFGSSYSEVLDPKGAVVNEETYKSDSVKAGLDGLIGLTKTVGSLKEALVIFLCCIHSVFESNIHTVKVKDNQADISATLQSELSAGKIRSILNQVNSMDNSFC